MSAANTKVDVSIMRCTSADCKREFETPIEIFTGQLICPHCGSLLGAREFVVDAYNDNLFSVSEMCYGEYLNDIAVATQVGATADRITLKRREELLATAIWNCREAAKLGHPGARVMLGYYWEIGCMDKGSELDRYKMAFHYYTNVAETEIVKVIVPDGSTGVGAYGKDGKEKLLKVRREAAIRLLRMLASAPVELEYIKNGESHPYSLVENIQKMKSLDLITEFHAKRSLISGSASRTETLYRTLTAIVRREDRAPIFGYFVLSKAEFIAMYENGEGKKSLKAFIAKHYNSVDIFYSQIDSDGRVDRFIAMDPRGLKLDEEEDGDIVVYYHNQKPKISPAVSSVRSVIKKLPEMLIARGDASGLMNLVESEDPISEHSFTAEDIFFAAKRAKRKKQRNAIVALAEYLKGLSLNDV